MSHRFEPKIVTVFRDGYTKHQLIRDLTAGLIVGIVALPLAIAFAIASGVKPEQGLYTAVVAGFVIAAFGGSRAQISGPTGAFIVVIYSIVQQHGYEGLAVATLIAGVLLVLMGLLGLGTLLKFVPYPLTVGFTSGIALIIFSSQVKDFLGLNIEKLPADFVEKWLVIIENLPSTNFCTLLLSCACLSIVIYAPRISQRIPGSLIAIIAATVAVQVLNLPVETIGSRFGAVPSSLPMPSMPALDWQTVQELFPDAVTIAILGGIESLLSAVVADGMLGTRHRSDMELVAQGLGNIVSPIFQGIPATGAIARTATNIKNGGRTPISALTHVAVLLLIMVCFGKYAALIPLAALAAILVSVAYNMSEWHSFLRIFKYPRSDVAVLLVTFFLTVFIDLTVAIQVGVVLSAFLFIRRMENTAGVDAVTDQIRTTAAADQDPIDDRDFSRAVLPPGVEVFEAFGPIFFSAIDRFKNAMARVEGKPKVLILYIKRVSAIDGSGLHAIRTLCERTASEKGTLLIAGAVGQPSEALRRAEIVPESYILTSLEEALKVAQQLTKDPG